MIAPAGVFNTPRDRIHTRISGNFDAAREIGEVVVGRVAAGSESPSRQTLTEFQRELQAGVVTIKLRTGDFRTSTRQRAFSPPSAQTSARRSTD